MQTPEPILVVDLFPLERAALLDLLESLDPVAWERATVCTGWAVRDLAAHLVGDDLGLVSRARDAYRPARRDHEDLVVFINRQNAEWVQATRRLSPRVLRTLLEVGGRGTQRHFESLDPFAMGGPVSWASGDERAPIYVGRPASTNADVELTQDDFWRLVTKGITPAIAETRGRLSGDLELARRLLTTVAIIA
jgi:hypothetical protein